MECSIIIPYYQRKQAILNTLKSLNNQIKMDNNFEVILINDGSDDFNYNDIKLLNLSIPIEYYKYPRSGNSGRSFARNRGIEKANGDLLIFLDCDIIVKPDFVFQHKCFWEKCPEKNILQIGMRNMLNTRDEDIDISNIKNYKFTKDPRFILFELYSENISLLEGVWRLVQTHNISITRDLVEKYGGFDEGFKGWGLEDCEFAYKLYKEGIKILYNPNIECFHQVHNVQLTEEEKFLMFERNLNYFIIKYDEIPVILLKIFCDFFNPVLFKKKLDYYKYKDYKIAKKNIWLSCFTRFENSIRAFNGIIEEKNKKEITLISPKLHILRNKLKNNKTIKYRVICKKEDIELITWIQVNKLAKSTELFII